METKIFSLVPLEGGFKAIDDKTLVIIGHTDVPSLKDLKLPLFEIPASKQTPIAIEVEMDGDMIPTGSTINYIGQTEDTGEWQDFPKVVDGKLVVVKIHFEKALRNTKNTFTSARRIFVSKNHELVIKFVNKKMTKQEKRSFIKRVREEIGFSKNYKADNLLPVFKNDLVALKLDDNLEMTNDEMIRLLEGLRNYFINEREAADAKVKAMENTIAYYKNEKMPHAVQH